MKRDIKKLIASVAIVAVSLVVLDLLVGFVCDKLWFTMPYTQSEGARANYYINETKADVVVIGASRAVHHYVPEVLSDSLRMSVVVAGRNGHDFIYNSCILHSIIERYTPKLVIFDLGEGWITGSCKNRISSLNPYYNTDEYIRESIDETGDWSTRMLMHSNMYRYNGKLLKMLNGYTSAKENHDGYIPIASEPNLQTTGARLLKKNEREEVNEIELKHLKDIFEWGKQYGFGLIVFDSPRYLINEENYTNILPLCYEYGTPCFDMSNDSLFMEHAEWFKDESHLNVTGACVYTQKIANIIKNTFQYEQ